LFPRKEVEEAPTKEVHTKSIDSLDFHYIFPTKIELQKDGVVKEVPLEDSIGTFVFPKVCCYALIIGAISMCIVHIGNKSSLTPKNLLKSTLSIHA
jgi:hypothetical protein